MGLFLFACTFRKALDKDSNDVDPGERVRCKAEHDSLEQALAHRLCHIQQSDQAAYRLRVEHLLAVLLACRLSRRSAEHNHKQPSTKIVLPSISLSLSMRCACGSSCACKHACVCVHVCACTSVCMCMSNAVQVKCKACQMLSNAMCRMHL